MRQKTSWTTKGIILILCFVTSSFIFWNVSSIKQDSSPYATSSVEGVYVIEDIQIDYRYDKTKYEIVPFINKPYVVIKGNKALINKMKWSNEEPTFYIELSGKLPGTYQERVQYEGIDPSLTVEVYPSVVDLRIMEQQTMKFVPQIDLVGTDKVDKNYVISLPELLQAEVMVRDIQDKLNQISSIRGTIDVSKLRTTTEFEVKLQVYDRENNLMTDVNLLETSIKVRVPIQKKTTIVNEQVVKEVVVVEEVVKQPTQPPKVEDKPTDGSHSVQQEKPVPKGTLSFVHIPDNLVLTNLTPNLTWTYDVKVDLNTFLAGVYEMTIKDGKQYKVLKFRLEEKKPVDVKPEETLPPKEEVKNPSDFPEDEEHEVTGTEQP